MNAPAPKGEPKPEAWLAGLRGRCPSCGQGAMFSAYLKIADRCTVCGEDFRAADSGDGPAVFVMFVVGAVAAPLLFILQFAFKLAPLISIGVTLIVALALCLALLPVFKGVLFALQWKHKARPASAEDIKRR